MPDQLEVPLAGKDDSKSTDSSAIPDRSGSGLFWSAYTGFCFCVGMTWSAGVWLQRWNATWGLVLTELGFFAIPALGILWRHRRELSSAPFRPPARRHWPGILLLASSASGLAVASGIAVRRFLGLELHPPELSWSLLPVIWFLAPACEELWFRPGLQRILARYWSAPVAVFITAGLFTLMHGSWLRFGETLILGLLGGVLYQKTANYWACLMLHVIGNVAGPCLYGDPKSVFWLSQPAIPLGLVFLAGLAIHRLTPPLAGNPAGGRLKIRWLWSQSLTDPPKLEVSRGMKVGLLAVGSVMVTMMTGYLPYELAAIKAAQESASPTQNEHWTLQAGEILHARTTLRYAHWPDQLPLELELPYAEARPLMVNLAGMPVSWTINTLRRVQWSGPTNDLSATNRTLELFWEVPLRCLGSEPDYQARLWPLVAVGRFSLDLALEPTCGFEFAASSNAREQLLTNLSFHGLTRQTQLGYCRLGIRRKPTP